MSHSRRQFLAGAAGLAISAQFVGAGELFFAASNAASPTDQDKKRTRVILLGTKGGPRVSEFRPENLNSRRSNPSTLILINDIPYLVDCGYGTSRQMLAAGFALDRLRYVFITHHHSDHNLEIGPLFYNAWITGVPVRMDVYGPGGLQQMTKAFFAYQEFDIETRIVDEGRPDPRKLFFTHEFDKSGVVMENDDVKVSARMVPHPPIKQSYAYRFDAKDRSVVITGDTAYAPDLAEFAKGANVLVHEVMYLPGIEALIQRLPNAKRLREHLLAAHTLTEDVGKIAAQAGVETVVLSHFVPGDDPTITDEQWSEGVRKHFKGKIIVGRDLLEI
jgi:ribonuclease BN (tRNA processing enzyme)